MPRTPLALAVALTCAGPAAFGAGARCPGDRNLDGTTSVAEVVACAAAALQGSCGPCAACDVGGDGAVRVEDLMVVAACSLAGCPPSAACRLPEPTPSPPPSPTPTATPRPSEWHFVEVARAAGLGHRHRYDSRFVAGVIREVAMLAGGAAAGDYDGDGWVDLFVVGGEAPDRLYRNNGDGTFTDVARAAGVAARGAYGCGPSFADLDGDGDLDLFVGAILGRRPRFYRNRGDGTFEDVSDRSGYPAAARAQHIGAAFGDADGDGDLDMAVAHWGTASRHRVPLLWRNDGTGTFAAIPLADPAGVDSVDFTFSPAFADIDSDGLPDLLVAADFGTSRIYRNRGAGVFEWDRAAPLTDENGMGSAVADYDGDGDLDWFVTSVFDPDGEAEANWGVSGNRLYRNRGDGTFEDATDEAGVREGFWGWAACAADFDNDGDLDLFHVNGFGILDRDGRPWFEKRAREFFDDPAILFVNRGDGTFTEQARRRGIADTGQGRGVVCFDHDRDGDIDVFIMNNGGPNRLYRNDCAGCGHFLGIRLRGPAPNTAGIGARIHVEAGGRAQMRELHLGNSYVSHDPPEVHFGLGAAQRADRVGVDWPDGAHTELRNVEADAWMEVVHPALEGAVHRWRGAP